MRAAPGAVNTARAQFRTVSRSIQRRATRVILCGGTARVIEFTTYLSERFGCPVELLDPLRNVAKGKELNLDRLEDISSSLAVAVGLALRFLGDKP